jgi:hypothetical protein
MESMDTVLVEATIPALREVGVFLGGRHGGECDSGIDDGVGCEEETSSYIMLRWVVGRTWVASRDGTRSLSCSIHLP